MGNRVEMSVWIDLDGVLADFDRGFTFAFGRKPREVADDQLWPLIAGQDGFFSSLPPVKDAVAFFSAACDRSLRAGRTPRILTACPIGPLHGTILAEKRRWVAEQLDATIDVVASDIGVCKSLHMRTAQDILVDDWQPNIEGWRAAGGIGILWRDHADALKKLENALPTNPTKIRARKSTRCALIP